MLETKYQTQESAIASYSFTDMIQGVGYAIFYAGQTGNASMLSTSTFYSYPLYITSSASSTDGTYHLIIDQHFYLPVNTNQVLFGNVIANTPVYFAGSTNGNLYCTINLIKIRSGVPTTICTGNSLDANSATATYTNFAEYASIATPTPLNAGDTLDLNVQVYVKKTGGGFTTTLLGCDPMNKLDAVWTSTSVGTQLKIQVPFRIDL